MVFSTICVYCEHIKIKRIGCDAFPNGIPTDILQGDPHLTPIEEQGNALVFTPSPDVSDKDADYIFEDFGIDIKPRIIDPEEIEGVVFRSRMGTPIPDAVIVSGIYGYNNGELTKQFTLLSDSPYLRRGWKLKYQDDEDSPERRQYLKEKLEEIAEEMRSEGWEVELATDNEGRPEAHLRHINTLKEVDRLANKDLSKSIDTTKNTLKPSEKNPLVNRWQKNQGNSNLPSKNEVMVIDPEDNRTRYDLTDMSQLEKEYYYYEKCSHRTKSTNRFQAIKLDGLCWECKKKLIGTRQNVVRFGNIPESGHSKNYASNSYEEGVSVYFEWDNPRGEFQERDKVLKFSAIVVGYGSDDEPLIDADTIKPVDYKSTDNLARDRHKNQLYGNGQPYFEAHIAPVAEIASNLANEVNPELRLQAMRVAYLHDIIEDTPTTKEELAERYGQDIANSVELLSKKPEQTEDNYLSLISGDEVASIVKAADRIQNILGLNEMTDGERKEYLIDKYTRQTEYFEKYNIFPEKIREAINQIK